MEVVCEEENLPTTSNIKLSRLGICEVCGSGTAKYTCPRCEIKTCCLKCTNIHKKELECNGTRDKTKFIPIKKFTNLELASDYRLLEEITRSVENLKKNAETKYVHRKHNLPHNLYGLQMAAKQRRIILKFLPKNFVRRKENTTYFKFKENVIYWHIDWIFFNADNLKLSESNVVETTRLGHILHKYCTTQEDAVLQEKLQYYQAVNPHHIKIFLKAEQKAGNRFYELDPLLSLKDNLKNKIIIEHPIIHLVLKEHSSVYSVLDSDDEEDYNAVVKQENGHVLVDRMIKNSEKEDSIDNSLKNLLFLNEDQTDSDMSDG